MDAYVKGYSQWFPGKKNSVADALSQEWHRGNAALTNILCSLFPEQIPASFCNFITPQVDQLLADFTAMAFAHDQAVTGGTHSSQSHAWGR
jgi:hypothetical protein